MTVSPHDIAHILSEALPHMQRYDEETVVVKYGGHAMGQEEMAKSFARDVVLLEQTAINPVVVHGGGPQIGEMLKRLGIKSEFAAGLRVTDRATIEIVEMVLAGSINKQIVGFINEAGGKAVGLCGKDGNMVTARKISRTIADHGADPNPRPRPDPGAGSARNLRRRRHLQRQRRHLRGGDRGRAQGQAAPPPHRCRGRARQVKVAHS
jgi:acetylglutamate kinase